MNNIIKWTDEELQSLIALQDSYTEVISKFGQIQIEKINLNSQIERLNDLEKSVTESYVKLQELEKNFSDSIRNKYGEGEINLETGEYTLISTSV